MNLLVFDFDGTIADTLEAIVTMSNYLAPQYGLKPATPEELTELRDLSFDQLISRADVPLLPLFRLLRRVRRELQKEIAQLSPFPNMAETLRLLAEQGQSMGILTSNSVENVRVFLQVHQLEASFEFVQGGTSLFGKSRRLKKLMRQRNLLPSELLYIGDETRDVDASRRIGIPVAAVTWGFNSRQALLRHDPDFVLERPSELITIVNGQKSR